MIDNLKIALGAAIEAGEEINRIYESSDFQVDFKSDDSPLTKADIGANDIINTYLEPTGIPIISEENKQLDYSVRKDWEICWLVDPLDGTKEFIKRNGEFTVNIALIKQGHPILGVIYVPTSKELYFSDVEKMQAYKVVIKDGWSLEDVEEHANLIQSKERSNSKIRIVGSRSHMNDQTKQYAEKLALDNEVEIVSKGSSLKFCLVAEGKADVYPRFAPTMEWDTGAGHAICLAAGFQVINDETKKELLYNKENLLNPWFLVSKN
jgi:3'(2'), 5'-bisphosphate nucleotidase